MNQEAPVIPLSPESELISLDDQKSLARLLLEAHTQITQKRSKKEAIPPAKIDLPWLEFERPTQYKDPVTAYNALNATMIGVLDNPTLRINGIFQEAAEHPLVYDEYHPDDVVTETILYRLGRDMALIGVIEFDHNLARKMSAEIWTSGGYINDFIRSQVNNKISPEARSATKTSSGPVILPDSWRVAHS